MMTYSRGLSKKGQSGFSLLEVIVVVAIMAVLGTVLAPQLLRYVNQNRATACQVDREGILAVYERCIYEETKKLDVGDLQVVMDGMDADTENEIKQFEKCPLNGTYTAIVDADKGIAMITCSCAGHEDAIADFAMWETTQLAEGIDEPFTQPPEPSVPEPDEPDTEEPSSTEEEPVDGGVWPYSDDSRWGDTPVPGDYVEIPVPIKFTTREGNTYVISDRNNLGVFPVHWEWNRGPEYMDAAPSYGIFSWSGVTITDISTVMYTNPDPNDTSKKVTGIHYGDIVVLDGNEYIYGGMDNNDPIPMPTPDNPGQFYYVGKYTP